MDRQAAVASVRTWRGSQAEHPRPLTSSDLAAGSDGNKQDSGFVGKMLKNGVVEKGPIR
jgi:hypothetical protein